MPTPLLEWGPDALTSVAVGGLLSASTFRQRRPRVGCSVRRLVCVGRPEPSVANGDLDPAQLVTHHFNMDDIDEAYDTFQRAGDTGALKIVLTPETPSP